MQKPKRAHNFNAGPSALPLPVLEQAQEEMINFKGTGMSIMELSHRSATYDEVHIQAIQLLKELLEIPEEYDVLFLQGGASLQFSMIPMNFLNKDKTAGYIRTGSFAEKAFTEAKILGEAYSAASTKEENFRRIPAFDEIKYNATDAYIHLTSNNTVMGTEWADYPNTGDVPLVGDLSSDILSRPLDVSKFALIYAGAQKNLGPSGVTVVILRRDMLERANKNIPTMLRYDTHVKGNSLYNTPPTFGIYMLGKVLAWVKEIGGVPEVTKRNTQKAALLYNTIDESNGFYAGHAEKNSRSLMNVTFRVKDEAREKAFLAEAKKEGFVGVNGHRSVGGCRVSIYNAVSYESCLAFSQFMKHFQQVNG